MLDVTGKERDYLVDVLEHAHRELLHELHHTDVLEAAKRVRSLSVRSCAAGSAKRCGSSPADMTG